MSFDRHAMKSEARERMRTVRPRPILVSLVVLCVMAFINSLSLRLSGSLEITDQMIVPQITLADMLFVIALDVVSQILYCGYLVYTVRTFGWSRLGLGTSLTGLPWPGR